MALYLENYISDLAYDDASDWHLPDLSKFSHNKSLYDYQKKAIENITQLLYCYYNAENSKTKNYYDGRVTLYQECLKQGMPPRSFNIHYKKHQQNFDFLQNYFPANNSDEILGSFFFNRACFWMATGSGKSLVIIKTIQLLDYLQQEKFIPKKNILLLLPREDLIRQFKKECNEFNIENEKEIKLVDLRDFGKNEMENSMLPVINVYYYRSDLLRDEKKESILDFKNYENNGNWYLLLDEAHRGEKNKGEKKNSKIQNYIAVLSRKGFLFNFSATFTDPLDFATTCYNFNLEKFIQKGHGKNIYVNPSFFDFRGQEEINEREKQKQVLKSLINLALAQKIKKSLTKKNAYHTPLLVTLVQTVNTNNSDLLQFFKELGKIANGKIEEGLLEKAKEELKKEWYNNRKFTFGEEKLEYNIEDVEALTLSEIKKEVFHSKNDGKIEITTASNGKELALKLQTGKKFFALIKIGDSKKFQKEQLGDDYLITKQTEEKSYFAGINKNDDIVMLLGSRSFYEGWDSNRPNILNFINIGVGKEAKKFVLQAIGRGVRIEPEPNKRKRTKEQPFLETLFIYATNKKAVESILETVYEEKKRTEQKTQWEKNPEIKFDLLIPFYKSTPVKKENIENFYIAEKSSQEFQNYFSCFDKNTFLLTQNKAPEIYDLLQKSNVFFKENEENHYSNMDRLLKNAITHLKKEQKIVEKVGKMDDDKIIHFKNIKLFNFNESEKRELENLAKNVINYSIRKNTDDKKAASEFAEKKISKEKLLEILKGINKEEFKKDNNTIFCNILLAITTSL